MFQTEGTDIRKKRRRPRRSRRIKIGRLFITTIFILIVGWLLVGGIKSLLFRSLVEVASLEPKIVTQDITTPGVLIKQEYLINAPLKGTVEYTLADGQRVKAGSAFGVVKTTSLQTTSGTTQTTLRASVGGVLCNHLDGLETILVPGNLDVVEIPALDKIEEKSPLQSSTTVENGQPVAKVIDNLAPIYFYGLLNQEAFKQIEKVKDNDVKLKWHEETIEAKVEKLISGQQPVAFFSIKQYPDEILHSRKVNLSVNVGSLEGILVDEASLVKKNNQVGLYLVWKGLVRWFPVEVTGKLRGQAAIKGENVQPGVSYIVNPRYAREGDKL